jgi:rubrerythrin
MAFSEDLKLKVKKKAMFQCCRCQAIGPEIHHIDYQRDHGADTIDNAAPLCPNCHAWFGDNPLKKKEIKDMRDNWYETVERMYSGQASSIFPLVEKVNDSLEEIKREQSRKPDLDEIKNLLKEISNKAIDNMNVGSVSATASNMVTASGVSLSNVRWGDIAQFVQCAECGEGVFVKENENACPRCGAYLNH